MTAAGTEFENAPSVAACLARSYVSIADRILKKSSFCSENCLNVVILGDFLGDSMTSQTFDSTLSFQLEVISRTSSGVPHFYDALTV